MRGTVRVKSVRRKTNCENVPEHNLYIFTDRTRPLQLSDHFVLSVGVQTTSSSYLMLTPTPTLFRRPDGVGRSYCPKDF